MWLLICECFLLKILVPFFSRLLNTALRKIKEVLIHLCKAWHFSLPLNFRGYFYEEASYTLSLLRLLHLSNADNSHLVCGNVRRLS